MIFTKMQEVLDHLYALPKTHDKADLRYIKQTLAALGHPEAAVKTIHVTGTNGKGSTSYYLSNLLQKAGQRTGLFVSPYVFTFGERIQLNGQPISAQALVQVANQVEQVLAQLRQVEPDFALVTFEYEVAMAFTYFAQEHCDYAVIEVGIGGAHDKTNVIIPEVSVITTVGQDHQAIIGPTLGDIAREKSGIIKAKRPVVLGNVPASVLPLVSAKARQEEAACYRLGADFVVQTGTELTYQDTKHRYHFAPRPEVEAYDAAVALKAFLLLQLPLSVAEITAAINQTVIPGRYQILQNRPLILLDGAHNQQALANLLTFVHQQAVLRGGAVRVLFMMMRDKDLAPALALFNENDQVHLTTITYPRAAKLADYPAAIQHKYPYQADWAQLYCQLKRESQPDDILLVTGSFYLVGQVLQLEAENESSRY